MSNIDMLQELCPHAPYEGHEHTTICCMQFSVPNTYERKTVNLRMIFVIQDFNLGSGL